MKKIKFVILAVLCLTLTLGIGIAAAEPAGQVNGGAIQFGLGQSSAWISGHVDGRSKIKYSFYAMEGQVVSISLKSVQNTAYFGLSDDQGTEYLQLDYQYKVFTLPLRRTATYYLTIYDDNNGTDFNFQLTIPPLNPPAGVQPYQQNGGVIQMASGQSTAWVNGYVPANSSVQYQFYASRNQVLSLALKATNGRTFFGLVDGDGNTYLSKSKEWSYYISPLYYTGMYNLTVYNTGGDATQFSFQLTIPPASPSAVAVPVQPQQPQQPVLQPTQAPVPVQPGVTRLNGGAIAFGAGETAAVIAGNVQANVCNRYTFYAGNNYPLIVMLSSANGQASLGLSDATGTNYLSSANRYTYWMMPLAKTTTYNLDVCNSGQQATDYSFNIIIAARINFAPNTSSAVKSGAVKANGIVSYAIYASAGQTMNIALASTATPAAFLRITGMGDGKVYLDNNSFQTGWSSVLPATQDYLIDVVSYGQAANYQLNVSVR